MTSKVKSKKRDLMIILLWPIIASLLTIIFEELGVFTENFFVSIILFLAFPSIYLSFRLKRNLSKIILIPLVISLPLMVIIEYFGYISLQWSFPPSVFPFAMFGVVTMEPLIWIFFNVYFVIVFYEYFLNSHHSNKSYNAKFKYLFLGMLLYFLIFLFLFFNFSIPSIPYFYLYFGLVLFGLPIVVQFILFSKRKKLISNMLLTAAYFFYLSFFV